VSVYKAIAAVQGELAKDGISKDRTNDQQHYKFRGIDDVYGALAPLLSKHGLCFLPRVLSRSCDERETQKGGTLFSVVVECEFDLVAAEDGSKHTIRTIGEAMDSGDKATNKAMSAAYKYAAFQAFCIPCEGEDADSQTHEVAPRTSAPRQPPARPSTAGAIPCPPCPKCGGPCWDNRADKLSGKTKPNAPDAKCKKKKDECDGVIWDIARDARSAQDPSQPSPPAETPATPAASNPGAPGASDALLEIMGAAPGITAGMFDAYCKTVMHVPFAEIKEGWAVALKKKTASGEVKAWCDANLDADGKAVPS
jgi:hypothetical protein